MKAALFSTAAEVMLVFVALKAAQASQEPYSMPVFLTAVFLLYMMPSIVGLCRGVANLGMLIMANLLLGWTILGWFACNIIAYGGVTREQDRIHKALNEIVYEDARKLIASRSQRPRIEPHF